MVTTTSTPIEQQNTPENRVILKGVSWSTFKALLVDVGDDRAWRIAYDEGVLEIRMPLEEHEEPKRLIESFVEVIVDELEIELRSLGSLTLEREDLTRAVEPDSCFYIQNESLVRGRNINLPNDPPPDLAIESDYTNSSINKFTIYAALGVPELWRYRRESLQVYQLVDGKYKMCDRSLAFPFLPVAEIPGLIEQSRTIGQRAAVRLFRQRIREILPTQS
ncbi:MULTISPECIES: Uma2 family endonuclease [unclassified Microcoleus]|uniref:Uma2 family endonuclease n=1 Tax=unclassified Microcoleus TaxID=2642155 RepID=UPI002FD075D8